MEKRTLVVVCGRSLNMAGIAASLNVDNTLEVVCIDPHSPVDWGRLNELDPTAIVFDLNDPSADVDIMLLQERPDLLVIGADLLSDTLLILSCHPQQAQSMAELIKVIRQADSDKNTGTRA